MYYKVVSEDLQSIIARNKLSVQYRINEYVQAPEVLEARGYGLLVFDSLDNALRIINLNNWYRPMVFECKVIGIRVLKYRRKLDIYILSLLKKFNIDNGTYYANSTWPRGTVMVKSVKLVRECTIK